MQPSPMAETSRLLFPSLRFFIFPHATASDLSSVTAKRRAVHRPRLQHAVYSTSPRTRSIMYLPPDAGDEFRDGLNVLERRSKIYDTCPQCKLSIDNRVGQERLSAEFDSGKEVLVQAVQVLFGFSGPGKLAQFQWHVSKRGDAESTRERFQLPM